MNARGGIENLLLQGVSCHIGSQLLDPGPLIEAVDRVLELIEPAARQGIRYSPRGLRRRPAVAYKPEETAPEIGDFVTALVRKVEGKGLHVGIEPGRSIVGSAGVLLTRVLYRKKTGEKEFVIVDAAMNDLIRPALYSAHHEILPLRESGREEPARRCGRTGLRDRRFSGARSRFAGCVSRGFAGGLHRWGVWIRAGFELQRPSASGRGAGGGRGMEGDTETGEL